MKPTAMQRPPEKGGKLKDTAPPPTLPKHSTTVTVVCNGVRSVASSPSFATDFSDDFTQLRLDRVKTDSEYRKHRSVIYVDSRSQNTTSPASPRGRAQEMVNAKTPPPAMPRPHSVSYMESERSKNGHSTNGANHVTDLDFISSLPPLPSDDLLATPMSIRSDKTSTVSDSSSDTGIEVEFPSASYDSSGVSNLPPVPEQHHGVRDPFHHRQRGYAGGDEVGLGHQSGVYDEHERHHNGHRMQDAGYAMSDVVASYHTGYTMPHTENATPEADYRLSYIGSSIPNAGYATGYVVSEREHSSPHKDHAAPPVAKKSAVPRPPPLFGISENGLLQLEEEEEEDGSPAHRQNDVIYRRSDFDGQGMPQEVFHIHMLQSPASGVTSSAASQEPTFAGRRDVRDPGSLHERQIVSSKGTVRGFKNRVRAGIATFLLDMPSSKPNYRVQEKGRIVVYTTSMNVVRETYDRCKAACTILQTHMVRYEARDLYMSREHQRQLQERLDTTRRVILPQIFADGIHLGGADDLENLNESGELRKILQSFPKIQVRISCDQCGGYRWVPCMVCHGSKKSVHRNNFTEEFCALRCMHCNESGLQRCQMCLDQQE